MNHPSVRLSKTKTLLFSLLLLTAVLALSGCTLGIFDQVIPPEPVRVTNESGRAFSLLGICWEGHLLLHKAAADDVRQAVFPGKLLDGAESVRLVGITSENQVFVSEAEKVKGKDRLELKAVQPAVGEDMPLLSQIPPLDQWQTSRAKGQVSASFQGDTALHYRVFVLGRGTRLAPSDWNTQNEPVQVSWEENRGMTQSWLLLKAE